jgi:hypothetical protein
MPRDRTSLPIGSKSATTGSRSALGGEPPGPPDPFFRYTFTRKTGSFPAAAFFRVQIFGVTSDHISEELTVVPSKMSHRKNLYLSGHFLWPAAGGLPLF